VWRVVTGGRRRTLVNRFVAAALAGGLSLAGAGAGHAQVQAGDGMDCVYNELIDRYDLVAEDFLYGDLGVAGAELAVEALATAKATCAARHAYSPGQLDTAGDLGILASAMDYLSEELLYGGVSEEAVSGILDAYDTFTDEDVDAIFDPAWRSDTVFHGKLKAKMLSAGIPDDSDSMDIALSILELAAMAEEATYMFVLGDDADAAAAN
jgi:hypothetical protein